MAQVHLGACDIESQMDFLVRRSRRTSLQNLRGTEFAELSAVCAYGWTDGNDAAFNR
jgi:hypothetical protein